MEHVLQKKIVGSSVREKNLDLDSFAGDKLQEQHIGGQLIQFVHVQPIDSYGRKEPIVTYWRVKP